MITRSKLRCMKRFMISCIVSMALMGCVAPTQTINTSNTSIAPATSGLLPPAKPKIMIFGGRNHNVYLGCLSCEIYEYDSIFNPSGPYGRCQLFEDNLYCRGPFQEFGSKGPFQDLSACASGASNPPVIVDKGGNYYGRFSVAGVFSHSDAVCMVFGSFRNPTVCDIVKWVCEQ